MRRTSLMLTAVALCAGLATSVAAAVSRAATESTIRSGYYADNGDYKSAPISFNLRKDGSQTTNLALLCTPTNPAWIAGSGDAGIAVVAPLVKVHNGTLSYSGRAIVKPFSAGEKQTATSTLHITLHHVDAPTIHYTYEGTRFTETAAWHGTASSPACKSVANGGKATLFGPVPGE